MRYAGYRPGGPVTAIEGRSFVNPPEEQMSLPLDASEPTSSPPPPDQQRTHLLALMEVRGIGEASLKALVRAFPDLGAAWEATPEQLREVLAGAGLRNTAPVVEQIKERRQALHAAARTRLE